MRQSKLNIIYNGSDISENISSRLINFLYNDNKQGQADDIEIEVDNRDDIWINDWFPDKGAELEVSLALTDWYDKDDALSVKFGKFVIDELSASSKGIFQIKAIAAVCESAFKNQKKYKTWENATLKEIISSIAGNNNLSVVWKGDSGPKYKKVYQREQSDAAFIYKLVSDLGLKMKINREKISIYEDSAGDSGVILNPGDLANYSFKSKTFGIYDSCQVNYLNPDSNEVYTYKYKDQDIKQAKIFVVNKQVDSLEDAKKLAKAALKDKNSKEITASIELLGNPNLWSGQELKMHGFGVFDSTYILESVKHSLDKNGYRTSAELITKKV